MSLTTAVDMMKEFPPSLAAAKKMGHVPEDFCFYKFEWLGDSPEDWEIMKVTGGFYRPAKTGPRKGQPILIKGAEKTVYITDAEIQKSAAERKTAI